MLAPFATSLVIRITIIVIIFFSFVSREDMEKVNIKFHDNGTVTYQHNKILKYVPELSVGNKDEKITVPNIPLLVSTQIKYIVVIN